MISVKTAILGYTALTQGHNVIYALSIVYNTIKYVYTGTIQIFKKEDLLLIDSEDDLFE